MRTAVGAFVWPLLFALGLRTAAEPAARPPAPAPPKAVPSPAFDVRYFVFSFTPKSGTHVRPDQATILPVPLHRGTTSWVDQPPLFSLTPEATPSGARPFLEGLREHDSRFDYSVAFVGHRLCSDGEAYNVAEGPRANDPRRITFSAQFTVKRANRSAVRCGCQGHLEINGPNPGEKTGGSWGSDWADLPVGLTAATGAVVTPEIGLLVTVCVVPVDPHAPRRPAEKSGVVRKDTTGGVATRQA